MTLGARSENNVSNQENRPLLAVRINDTQVLRPGEEIFVGSQLLGKTANDDRTRDFVRKGQ